MSGIIDPGQPIPIYFQLKTLLLEDILGGRYDPDTRLPTEHELCALYGISRTPVTRALSELADEGVILRHRKRGSFVNPHWARRQLDGPEVRIIVPEGPWRRQIEEAAGDDVRVNLATVALPDLHQTLTRSVAEGRAPDLAVLDSVWVPEFAAARFLWPVDELDGTWVRGEYARDFLEPFVSANRVGGDTVAVQAEADVAGLWYRRETLERIGRPPPATWREFLQTARALVGAGVEHAVVFPGGSRGGETTAYCLLALLAANDVAVLGAGGVTLDAPATVATLRGLRQLLSEGLAPRDAVAFEWDRPVRHLAHGSAAMSFGGSYEARPLADAAGISLGELWQTFGFAAMPGARGDRTATLAGGMVYGVFRQAAQPELAMRLLKRLVAPHALAQMSRETAQIPSSRPAVDLIAGESELLSASAAMLERAVVRPAIPAYAHVSAQLQAMLEAVLTDRLRPAVAAARAAELIGAITGLPVVSPGSAPRATAASRA
jgi:multiple sugar transport system substrate-binding protein